MNILIISANNNKHPVAVMPIGACVAAEAAERSGHKVSFLDLMFSKNTERAILNSLHKTKPEIVGISVRNIDNNDMKTPRTFFEDAAAIVKIIKNTSNAMIILGGAAVGIMPEQLLRYTAADAAVLGYGETVFPELLKALEEKKSLEETEGVAWIDNGIFKRTEIQNAKSNHYPIPDFSRWIDLKAYLRRFSTVPVQTKRGCPYKCVYCTYAIVEGEKYYLCRPGYVADEVKRLAENGLRDIEFVDNVFNSPYEHSLEICKYLARKKTGARLQSMELNPKFITDELLDEMERAGFVGIGLTAESADDKVLAGLRKDYTADDVHRAAEVVKRHNLPCLWLFLLGGPYETPDTAERTFDFARACIRKSDTAFFNVGIRIYPGTELETIARTQSILQETPDEMLNTKFYFSPLLELQWLRQTLERNIKHNLNFIDSDSFALPALSAVQRMSYFLGVRQPLWKYTRSIRKIMRFTGAYK